MSEGHDRREETRANPEKHLATYRRLYLYATYRRVHRVPLRGGCVFPVFTVSAVVLTQRAILIKRP